MSIWKRLNYLQRLLGTGIAFLFFGIVGLVLTITVFPLIQLLAWNRGLRYRLASRTIHYAWRFMIWCLKALGVLKLTTTGTDILARDRGVIVIANHPSLLDVVLLIAIMKNTQCIVKQGVWNNPVMRSAVRSANYIPNSDDPEELLEKCAETLARGNNIIIFPEGSRSVPGQPMKLQRGFAHLALRIQAPLRLVELRCDPPTLLKGQKWYDIPPSRPHFQVHAAELLDLTTLDLDKVPSRAVRQVTRHVANRYREMLQHGCA